MRRLLESPALHADETGLRIGRKNHWLHSHGAGDPALKFVHRKRGRAAIDELNVIPRHGGVLVHDRWASHFGYENRGHALCGAHLPHDPAFVEDAHGHAWAKRMRKLLRDIRMAKAEQKVSGCFRNPEYAAAHCRISGYPQSMAHQGHNPLSAIQIALNGNAATMVGNPTRNNPDNQTPGGE